MNRLLNLINNCQYDFYFLVVDSFLDIYLPELKNFHLIYAYQSPLIEKLKQKNIHYFCLEEHGVTLETKNSGKLLSHPLVADYIKTTSCNHNRTPAIIPFKPSAKIEFICRHNRWVNVSNLSKTNRELEDKIKFPQVCQKFGISLIPFSIDKLTETNFKKAQKKFGQNLIIQTHFGWAGSSTFQAISWDEAKSKITPNVIVKFSPLLQGYTLINNCCLTKHGLIQSPPALQITGVKPLTNNPFTTVGRQWPSTAPSQVEKQIKKITNSFIQILEKYEYKGFFGLDFFVSEENVYLLECNPRLTASFSFYTKLEKKAKITPLFYLHLAELTGINYRIDIEKEQCRFSNKLITGTELTPKNKHNSTIKKIHLPHTVHSVKNLQNFSIQLPR